MEQHDWDPEFFKRDLWTDQALFTKDRAFNKQNRHQWSQDNPHAKFPRKDQGRFTVNLWTGIIDNGQFILPNPNNGNTFLMFLENMLDDLLEDVPLEILRQMWYQQDGAPAHYAVALRDHLNNNFPIILFHIVLYL